MAMIANERQEEAVPLTNIRRLICRPRRHLFVLVLVAALAAAAAQAGAGAVRVSRVPTLETQMLSAINGLRREHGLVPLRPSAELASAAQGHSLSMAEHGLFTHSSAAGSPFRSRVDAALRRFKVLGETMAWAAPGLTAQQALAMWLRSPRHRKTLLSPGWRKIGLGAVHAAAAPGVFDGLDVTILTADFAARS